MTKPARGSPDTILLVTAIAAYVVGLGAAPVRHNLEKYMVVLGMSLGPLTMNAAHRHFGGGTVVPNGGDAGAAKTHLCYVSPDKTALIFSCWECGDGQSFNREGKALRADEYWLVAGADHVDFGDPSLGYHVRKDFDPLCTLTRRLSRATTIGALRLGMERSGVLRVLGRPARETARGLEYVDGTRHLTIGLHAGKVVSIHGARSWE